MDGEGQQFVLPSFKPERNVGLRLVLLHVDRLVQIVVDEVIFGRLLADVFIGRRHADEVDLMERGALRADPRMLCVLLTVVEDLTADRVVRIVSRGPRVTIELRLLEQQSQVIRLLLLQLFLELLSLFFG